MFWLLTILILGLSLVFLPVCLNLSSGFPLGLQSCFVFVLDVHGFHFQLL